ncbi:hypothetical protein LMH87_010942 [Akanthomyces muscarius]|uniref:Uncharacterized protein n=1 Tax=Akanthomyces muscarius TaxID=2231603 RepID=A0A9W8Q870_AKAMU|nr:hypothetical protein LMH87_010942 [Akanthomyces muscarius]KAJ4150179.1 hypothetical protein LMH87_010942 [Akanthomyces muscarius]
MAANTPHFGFGGQEPAVPLDSGPSTVEFLPSANTHALASISRPQNFRVSMASFFFSFYLFRQRLAKLRISSYPLTAINEVLAPHGTKKKKRQAETKHRERKIILSII